MCIHTYIYIYIYVRISISTYVQMYIFTYIYIYIYLCIHMCVYGCVYIHYRKSRVHPPKGLLSLILIVLPSASLSLTFESRHRKYQHHKCVVGPSEHAL